MTTNKRAVLHLYTRLSSNSIDSFVTFRMHFRVQYVTNRPYHLIVVALANIWQNEDKSLRQFMETISSISVQNWDLSLEVALTSMIIVLKPNPFSDRLCKTPSTTLNELRARAIRFILMEEVTIFREKVCGESSKKPTEREAKIEGSRSQGRSKRQTASTKFSHYTQSIESQNWVLEKACSAELVLLSTKYRPPPRANKSKYCLYHWVVVHNTKECTTLKDKI